MKRFKSKFSRLLVMLLAVQILALPLVSAMEIHRCTFSGKIKLSLITANNCCLKALKPIDGKNKTTLERKSCCEKQQIVENVNLNNKTEQNLFEFLAHLSFVEIKNFTFHLSSIAFVKIAFDSSLRLLKKPKSLYLFNNNFRI